MDTDFPGYSTYTHSCWMRSRRVHAGCGGLGNGKRLPTPLSLHPCMIADFQVDDEEDQESLMPCSSSFNVPACFIDCQPSALPAGQARARRPQSSGRLACSPPGRDDAKRQEKPC